MIGMPVLYEFNSIDDNIGLAKRLGYEFIELNLNFKYCQEELLKKETKELFRKSGIKATLHFLDDADFASFDEIVEAYINILDKYLENSYEYIELLNIHLLPGQYTTISGIKHYNYEKEFEFFIDKLTRNLKRLESHLKKYNIGLVIENTESMPDFLVKTYDYLLKEGFKLTYDIGHDSVSGNKVFETMKYNNEFIKEFHFHDSDFKKCHLALGDGLMNLSKFKNLTSKDSYINIEVKSSDDLKKSIEYYKSI